MQNNNEKKKKNSCKFILNVFLINKSFIIKRMNTFGMITNDILCFNDTELLLYFFLTIMRFC